jgi:hypothetical protein
MISAAKLADHVEITEKWYTFLRFGSDPDGAFSVAQDEFGFAGKSCSRIWFSSPAFKALGGEREL